MMAAYKLRALVSYPDQPPCTHMIRRHRVLDPEQQEDGGATWIR